MKSSFYLKKSASTLILLTATAPTFAAPTIIALSGTTTPGGGTYSAFANPVLNANGQLAFNASIAGGTATSGIFTGSTYGLIQAVALQGTAAPSGGNYGALYSAATSPTVNINSNGQLAFNAPLTAGTATSGVFTGTSALTLQTVALQGTAAPSGGNYNVFLAAGTNTVASPLINTSGKLTFQATLTGGTAAGGIFTGTAGSLSTVAQVGGAAPTPPGGTYATTVTVPTMNSNGQVAFVSIVGGNQGIFSGTPGSIQTVMYQGNAAPDTDGFFGTPTTTYSYNNAGQVGFISSLTFASYTNGIFVGAPGSVHAVALQGTTAPGTGGGVYGGLSSVTVNGAGQAAFTAAGLVGGGSNAGLFLGAPGAVKAVALTNQGDPDMSGAVFSGFLSTLLSNSFGQVVFTANLGGGQVTAGVNSQALFGGTVGNLTQLVRTGDVIDVNPDPLITDNRTVSGFGLEIGSGGQDGKGFSLNDSGTVAYRLTFTDGSTGVFESTLGPVTVPEPTSLGLLTVGVGMLMRRRSVKRR